MKKMILFATVLTIATVLLSLASPALARAPPGLVISPDIADEDSGQEPEPDLGFPNYWNCACYRLNGGGGYTGVYGHLYPQPINFETDWWTTTQEYWVQLTVKWDYHYYAEIGLDVTYHNIHGYWVWHTQAYAGYSDRPDGYGYVFAYYDLGWSIYGPADATLGVYKKDGSTWGWNVNGVEFATHTFPESWQGYTVHTCTEAYNQPVAGTSGQYISLFDSLYIKRADNGQWAPALNYSGHPDNGVYNGWMVALYATDGYRYDWSTRL